MNNELHKPEPQLLILTPLRENLPFNQVSIQEAFNIWAQPENWNLGLKILSINFDLAQVMFTWCFDGINFYSSFILVYTAKGQYYNDDIDQMVIQKQVEDAFNDDEINGDGYWDYTFNGASLVITLKHTYLNG